MLMSVLQLNSVYFCEGLRGEPLQQGGGCLLLLSWATPLLAWLIVLPCFYLLVVGVVPFRIEAICLSMAQMSSLSHFATRAISTALAAQCCHSFGASQIRLCGPPPLPTHPARAAPADSASWRSRRISWLDALVLRVFIF